MTTPTAEGVSVGLGEPRSRTELVLEMIALRHQIAALKRSGMSLAWPMTASPKAQPRRVPVGTAR